jgi:hypothetical protein
MLARMSGSTARARYAGLPFRPPKRLECKMCVGALSHPPGRDSITWSTNDLADSSLEPVVDGRAAGPDDNR